MARNIADIPCSFCGEKNLAEVINFGEVAIAGGFLKRADFAGEKKYPLRICFCTRCYAVQVVDKIDPAILFAHDFYFSSAIKTLRDHFAEYAAEVVARFLAEPKDSVVVEFGSNDGVLLKPIADQGVGTAVGVDPAKNIVETVKDPRLNLINDFFNVRVAKDIVERFGKADLVLANNTFAHISDINGITEAVTEVLANDGVFIFEVHYLGKIIEGMQYDMMYHEHIYYYSLIALQNHLARHGMTIFDIKPIPIHGGSIRYYACKNGSRYSKEISSRVTALRANELAFGYDKPETYAKFAAKCKERKHALMDLITRLRAKGRTIAGYGASGRANTIIQYCGIDSRHLEYMVDDAPAKQGYATPGSHLSIRGSEALSSEPPDYVLVFAWTFFNEIMAKCGGYVDKGMRFMVPLPDVRVTYYPVTDDSL